MDCALYDSYLCDFQVNTNISHVDSVIGVLMDGLMDRGLLDCVNVIVLADHGAVVRYFTIVT